VELRTSARDDRYPSLAIRRFVAGPQRARDDAAMIFEVKWSNGDRTELCAHTLRELDDFVGEQVATGADVELLACGDSIVVCVSAMGFDRQAHPIERSQ
jgi:hypothetical protein